MNRIKALFEVVNHNLTRIDGTMSYDRLTDSIIKLADTLADTETDEGVWYLGESGVFTLSDFIVGAYWHFSEWHGGQWSKGYQALSSLTGIFNPGMTSIDSEIGDESPSVIAYEMLNHEAEEYFDNLRGKRPY